MNESLKTTGYVGVALLVAALGVFTLPRVRPPSLEDDTALTEAFFPELKSGEEVYSVLIFGFDSETGKPEKVHLDRDSSGRWLIASHDNYPADAGDKIKDLIGGVIGLKALDVASEQVRDHAEYGVVEPKEGEADTTDRKNVGLLVEFRGSGEKSLARLVIGKKAQTESKSDAFDPSAAEGEQRFVRPANSDRVYMARVKPLFMAMQDKKRTALQFESWINKDLLRLKAADIDQIGVKDYGLFTAGQDPESGMVVKNIEHHSDVKLSFDEKAFQWQLDKLTLYAREKPVSAKLADNEELNASKLNDLKSTLERLEIVSAQAKPKFLAGLPSLDPAQIGRNLESLVSLQRNGFFIPQSSSAPADILCEAGEVQIGMKDGVEYRLRFGSQVKTGAAAAAGKPNRVLLVTARFNEERLPKPVPQPLLPVPPENPPADKKPEEKKSDDKKPEEKKSDDKKPDEKKADEKKPSDDKAAARKDILDENERLTKRNEQAQAEWESSRKKAQGRARDLNNRFAGWYYVVSEDVYRKVRLGRQDIIAEKKGGKDETFTVDAFRRIESEGLSKTPPPSAPPPGPGGLPPFGFPPM